MSGDDLGGDDCQRLLDFVMPFALEQLEANGEFFPFGACVDRSGRVGGVGATDGTESPPPLALIELLKDGLRERAADLRATAIVSNVDLIEPGGEPGDAVRIDYEHRDDGPVTIVYPYRLETGVHRLGEPFTADATPSIF